MKTKLLLLILFIIPFCANSQIHIIQNLDDRLIFGPDNIEGRSSSIYAYHMKELGTCKTLLQKQMAEKVAEVKTLSSQKRNKKKIKYAEELIAFIGEEIALLSDLEEKWKEITELPNEVLFHSEWKKDSCLIIISDSKQYLPHEYDLILANDETVKSFSQFFHVNESPAKETWVKKKADGNCKSSDPDDCLVWCLVKLPGGYSFFDASKVFYEIDDCPAGFEYSLKEKSCIKINNYKDNNSSVLITDRESGERIVIHSWEKTDCKNK